MSLLWERILPKKYSYVILKSAIELNSPSVTGVAPSTRLANAVNSKTFSPWRLRIWLRIDLASSNLKSLI